MDTSSCCDSKPCDEARKVGVGDRSSSASRRRGWRRAWGRRRFRHRLLTLADALARAMNSAVEPPAGALGRPDGCRRLQPSRSRRSGRGGRRIRLHARCSNGRSQRHEDDHRRGCRRRAVHSRHLLRRVLFVTREEPRRQWSVRSLLQGFAQHCEAVAPACSTQGVRARDGIPIHRGGVGGGRQRAGIDRRILVGTWHLAQRRGGCVPVPTG